MNKPIKLIKFFIFPLAFLSVLGCSDKKDIDVIDIASFDERSMSEFDFSQFRSRTVVLGSDLGGLGNPVKAVLKNDRIYILNDNMTTQNILVYSSEGEFISNLGTVGRGPGEYLGISDFTVASNGDVIIADGVANKLVVYDNRLEYVSTSGFPFEIEGLASLPDGYLVALALWDSTWPDDGVIVVDSEMGKVSTVLPHLEYYDVNFELSSAKFQDTDGGYFFNKSIDDNIYLISKTDGSLIRQYFFDFGSEKVPDDVRGNVESAMENGLFEDYSLILNFAVAGDGYACGNMLKNGVYVDFIADRSSRTVYIKNVEEDMDEMFIGYAGSTLVSVLLPQDDNDTFKLRFTEFPLK